MALPLWPGTVAYRPMLDPFRVAQLYDPPAVNQPEDGPAIMRRWASSNWTKLTYQMLCKNATERDTMITFFRDTLGHGSGRFIMPVGRKGNPSWPNRVVYITGGSIKGPDPYGAGGFTFSFELNVLDY